MALPRELGSSVPLEEFRETQRAAVLAAGRGRCRIEEAASLDVVFMIVDGRTDVMAEGFEKDGMKYGYGVVGDMAYFLERAYEDGVWTFTWTSLSIHDTRETMRFLVRGAGNSRRVGTPLALLDGLLGAEATVVSTDGDETTYAVQLAMGLYSTLEGDFGSLDQVLPAVDVHWTVDAADRPVRLADPTWSGSTFTFSEWGTAPEVVAPAGDVPDIVEYHMRRSLK